MRVDVELLSPAKRSCSVRLSGEGFKELLSNVNSVKIKQSLSGFSEGIEILSATLLKLNQARFEYEKRITALENVRVEAVNKGKLKGDLSAVKEEISQSVTSILR